MSNYGTYYKSPYDDDVHKAEMILIFLDCELDSEEYQAAWKVCSDLWQKQEATKVKVSDGLVPFYKLARMQFNKGVAEGMPKVYDIPPTRNIGERHFYPTSSEDIDE